MEKVWFHKCPSRGKACVPAPGNTKLTIPNAADGKPGQKDAEKWLVDEGGCAVWYDEPALLERVQTRVQGRLMQMDPDDFSIGGVLESPLPEDQRKHKSTDEDMVKEPPSRRNLKRKQDAPKAVAYGARKNDQSQITASKQQSAIAPVVVQLTDLERRVQQLFAGLMWGAYSGDASTAPSAKKQKVLQAKVATSAPAAPASKPAAAEAPAQKPKK